MKHSRRVACDVCETRGEVADPEMASGWRTCPQCLGQCWLDETPQPRLPHPDPEAAVVSSVNLCRPLPPWSIPCG